MAPAGYDVESGEPPFLNEYLLNKSALTFLGHAGIAMLQVALKLYLDAYKTKVEGLHGPQPWGSGKNWFARHRDRQPGESCSWPLALPGLWQRPLGLTAPSQFRNAHRTARCL